MFFLVGFFSEKFEKRIREKNYYKWYEWHFDWKLESFEKNLPLRFNFKFYKISRGIKLNVEEAFFHQYWSFMINESNFRLLTTTSTVLITHRHFYDSSVCMRIAKFDTFFLISFIPCHTSLLLILKQKKNMHTFFTIFGWFLYCRECEIWN